MNQDEVMYEPPMLVEVGNFAELTRGFGFNAFDSTDFMSSFSPPPG